MTVGRQDPSLSIADSGGEPAAMSDRHESILNSVNDQLPPPFSPTARLSDWANSGRQLFRLAGELPPQGGVGAALEVPRTVRFPTAW